MKTSEKHDFALKDTLGVYGIRRNPFPIDESDDFFFSTPMLAKQIDATAIADIHQDSGGLPGTIHSLSLHTLLASIDTSRLSQRPSRVTRSMIYVVAALILATLGGKRRREHSLSCDPAS